MQLIQAARRLYNPTGKKLPLPMVVELNRRLVKGYTHYKDDPRIINLKKSVYDYNKQLRLLGVRDHQVEYAKFSILQVVFTLLYRLGKIAVMAIGTLPGLVLFAPVFIASKLISIRKSREALAASTVKLQGRDVMATWKLLVALAFAPILYATYTIILTWWTYRNRIQGCVPQWVPLWVVAVSSVAFFISITFAALRFGETGMDIIKSLRPLVLSLNPTSANTLVKLRAKRVKLSAEVTEVINTLGPEMFPDFDSARVIADPFQKDKSEPASPKHQTDLTQGPPLSSEGGAAEASIGGGSSTQGHLPPNETFANLGDIGLFASRPPSRSRSRSRSASSGGIPLRDFMTMSSKESLDTVSQKIRDSMRQRGKERHRRKSEEEITTGWELAETDDGIATPDESSSHDEFQEEGKKDL